MSSLTSTGFLACSITKDEMVGSRPELTTRRGFGSPWFFYDLFFLFLFVDLSYCWSAFFCFFSFAHYLLAFPFVGLLYFCLLHFRFSMFVYLDFSCSTPPNKLVLSSRALPRCSVVAGLTRWEDFISSVRSSNSHPDLLVIHPPTFSHLACRPL